MRLKKVKAAAAFAFGLILLVTICSVLKKNAEPVATPKAAAQYSEERVSKSSDAELPATDVGPISATTNSAQPLPSFHQQLMNARDLRVLYLDFLQQGDAGGGLYAMNILMRCSAVRQRRTPTNWLPQTVAQGQAKAFTEAQCASFLESELSMDAVAALARDPRLKNDRLRSLLDTWVQKSQTSEGRASALSAVLQARDPLLLEQLTGAIFFIDGKIAFDGKIFNEPYALPILNSAWISAICDGLQSPCKEIGDPYLMEACINQNTCFSTRYELFSSDSDNRFGKEAGVFFREIYPRMVEAIRNQDAAAFDFRR